MKKLLLASVIALALLSLSATTGHADFIFTVSVNTSGLINDSSLTGPFGIDFQLVQGDGSVINTATISNINLGTGGAAVGSPSLTNSMGSLTNGVTLDDSNFFSDFNQQFTPGSSLTFTVDLTTNVGATAPDEFSFAILQNYGTANVGEIPTTDPSGLNTLITVNITSSTPSIMSYGGTDGDPPAPQVNVVPEPSTLMLTLTGLLGFAGAAWRRRQRSA